MPRRIRQLQRVSVEDFSGQAALSDWIAFLTGLISRKPINETIASPHTLLLQNRKHFMSRERSSDRQVREAIDALESTRQATSAWHLRRQMIIAECDLLDLALKNHSTPSYPAGQDAVKALPG